MAVVVNFFKLQFFFFAFMYVNSVFSVFGNVKVKIVLQTCMTDEISLVSYLLTIWSNDENVQLTLLY